MQKAVQRQRMGILLCEQNFRDVWIRNESMRAEIGQILHTDTHPHTHTTAAKLVVRIVDTGLLALVLTWHTNNHQMESYLFIHRISH